MIQPETGPDIVSCYEFGLLPDVVAKEAGMEPYVGKVGVAEVVLNRVMDQERWSDSIAGVVLQPRQFSCYNEGDPGATKRPRPDTPGWGQFVESCKATAEALRGSNYTDGANHYLNPDAVLRASGKLPSWYDEDKITARIGRHVFLRL